MTTHRSAAAAILLLSLVAPGAQLRAADTTLTLEQPQTAGMSMFRAHWDAPLILSETGSQTVVDPKLKERGGTAVWKDGGGALAFDALNRQLLVRFPDAAEKILAQLGQGSVIGKVEIVLPFRDEELWPVGNSDYIGPEGYEVRKNWGVDDLYRAIRPEWHAVACALRKPWQADAKLGPTFNANVNGASYWAKYGAQDLQQDRFPREFGPAAISYKTPEGRLDVTAALTDPAFGKTLAERLRTFADCGVLIRKWETYDARYFTGCYEWGTACGGRAILVKTPKLVVTLAPGKTADLGTLQPAAEIAAQKGGTPTAVMLTPEQLQELAVRYAAKPAWMPDWQWQRVQELYAAQFPEKATAPFWYQFVPDFQLNRLREGYRDPAKPGMQYRPAAPAAAFAAWVDLLIGRQPRGWSGFESARSMSEWYLYHDALPGPAQDAIKRYWTAWLMPDRETAPLNRQRDHTYVDGPLVHPMVDDKRVDPTITDWLDPLKGRFDTYWAKTGDWHGNKSFFRSGFCYWMSTQNFNSTSCAGALLAGAMIGSERAMADGRHGVEMFPVRMWCWADGSGQEHIDHYYYSISLAGNKVIADFAQTPYDRLLGQSLLAKNIEELVSAYHPGLRAYIAGSSRTSLDLVLGMQDGIYHALHTLSKSGTLRDYGTSTLPGNIATWGHDVPPAQAAQQTLAGPWAPEWVAPMVDDKPLPYEAKHTGWGGAQRTCHLGRNYGVASNAVNAGRFQVMAQWRRAPQQVAHMTELGTLDLRYSTNTTRWTNDGQGSLSQPGSHSILQARNKFIALTSPKNTPDPKVTSLQSSIGLFNFEAPVPTWEVYVDGQKVEKLPFTCKQGQRIAIRDGVTYLGIIPLPATDLGRDAEVVLEAGQPQKADFYQSNVAAALVINSYNYQRAQPLSSVAQTLGTAVGKAYGGFAVELADQDDYADFAAFQKHLADAKLDVAFDAATSTVSVKYVSGADTLEAASVTFSADEKDPTHEKGDANLVTWLVNGKDPRLPKGLERDTPYCQQALGHAAKNGAVFDADAERRIFLLAEPKGGVYCGWNPLPDLTAYRLTVPGGLTVTADGKIGLTRVVVRPAAQSVEIDSAFKPGQEKEPGTAKTFLIAGVAQPPQVTLNGKRVTKLETRTVDGKPVFAVPLP